MTDSVETKVAGTVVDEDAVKSAKDTPKAVSRPRIKVAEPKAAEVKLAEIKPRSDDLAKPAVEPIAAIAPSPVSPPPAKKRSWFDGHAIAAGTIGLAIGTAFGMVAAPRGSGDSLTEVTAALEAGRIEAARLNTEVERISNSLATIRESSEAARGDGRNLGAGLNDRIARLEQTLSQSLAAFGDKVEQADRAQGARIAGLAAQVEKRASLQTPAAVTPPAAKPEPPADHKAETTTPAKTEPAQTGSIADPKAKPAVIDSWALREVFDGIAILESRRRRLIEVAPGVQIPGVGRVESIERRGRNWVVVTKQGLITTQTW